MISRRALFGRIAGAGVAAASMGSAAARNEILSSLSVPSGLDPTACDPATDGHNRIHPYNIVEKIFERDHHKTSNPDYLPPEISTKKSWSVSYKSHVHENQRLERNRIQEELERNQELVEKMGAMLGLDR